MDDGFTDIAGKEHAIPQINIPLSTRPGAGSCLQVPPFAPPEMSDWLLLRKECWCEWTSGLIQQTNPYILCMLFFVCLNNTNLKRTANLPR